MRLLLVLMSLPSICNAQVVVQSDGYGQFAPPDAYVNGSKLAYYGSENEWNRRQFSARTADEYYKRRGQRQLLAILEGRVEEAVQLCQNRLAADPQDLESLFTLTAAWCQLNQPSRALETMKRAVANGMPTARFLAGPRELLQPLTSTRAFQKFLAVHPVRLIHGPMLGCMTDHSVKFWVRTAKEDLVTVRVFRRDQQSDPIPLQTITVPSQKRHDYTAVVEVTELEADTDYTYDVFVAKGSSQPEARSTFRTFPRRGSRAKFRVAFGGGAGYTPQHERIWDTIASFDPMAVLLLGDNVYIDLAESPGALHRYTYYRRQSRPEYRRLVGKTPVFTIWDDHDCAIDDVWMGPYRDQPSWKQPMLTLFQENWINPGYGSDQWPACWYKFSMADVDFFLLDSRFYRTNPFGNTPSMLGPAQLAWLREQIVLSKARFKVVVSAVAWAPGAKPGSRDTWDGFPEEREKIFSWLEANRIEGVVLVSADRHRSDVRKIDRKKGYPLYDFMSSRLTNIHSHKLIPGALFGYNEKCSFGLLTFDTTLDDPTVTYQVVSIDGELIDSVSVRRSNLTFH